MGFKLADLFVEVGAVTKPLDGVLAAIRGRIAGLAKMRFNIPGGGFAGMLGLGAAGVGIGKAISGASDLAETISKVRTTFGESAKGIEAESNRLAEAFGIPKREYLDSVAMYGLIAIGMGKTEKEAAALSITMAKAAVDSARFFNVPVEVALEKIRAGLTGESEPLKAFGIILDETNVRAQALAMGLAKKGQELSNSAKLAARAALIEIGLAKASGALERESAGASGQMDKFWGTLTNLGDTLGTTVLPTFTRFLGLLNEVATDMSKAAEAGSGSWAGFLDTFQGAIETAGVVYRNFGDIIERTGVMIGGKIMNVWEYVSYGNEVVGAVASYFVQVFVEAFDATLVAAGNMKDNFVALVQELWEALKSGGTHVIDVKFKPILEGANFGNAEFKMPELKLTDVQNQIDEIDKRMVAREAERGAKNAPAGAPKAGPNAPAGVAAAANSGKIGVTDAESYARELQEGALKSNKIQEGQLDQLKTIATNTGKLIGALGAGASRSPVAAAFG